MNLMITIKKNLLGITFLYSSVLTAQLYVGAGYGLLRSNPENFNKVINIFNTAQGSALISPMSTLRNLHGIAIDVAYFAAPLSVGLEWNNAGKVLENSVYSTATTVVKNTIYYTNDLLSFHADILFMESFGIGVALDYNIITSRYKLASSSTDFSLLNARQWSHRFYSRVDLWMNSQMSLSLRPYLRKVWKEVDYSPMFSGLNLVDRTVPLSPQTNHWDWGIMISLQTYLTSRSRASD